MTKHTPSAVTVAARAARQARYDAAANTVRGDVWQHRKTAKRVRVLWAEGPGYVRVLHLDSERESRRQISGLAAFYEKV